MTEPATDTPGTDIDILPIAAGASTDIEMLKFLGWGLAAAESKSQKPQALALAGSLRIAYAQSIGLPAHAASEVHVINGNLAISAKLKRALGKPHGITVDKVDASDVACTAVVYENGKELGRSTWTIERAQKRGIANRPNWKSMPDRMLWARASAEALDDFAPWVTVGVLSLDQAYDIPDAELVPFEDDE